MDRITKDNLEGTLRRLNIISKRTYQFAADIQGWRLEVQEGEHGGVNNVGYYGTKSETYYTLNTIIQYAYLEQKAKREDEQARVARALNSQKGLCADCGFEWNATVEDRIHFAGSSNPVCPKCGMAHTGLLP